MDKAEERYYLDLCLKLRPEMLVTDIQDTEAPDFLASHEGQRIGIELVRFHFKDQKLPSPAAFENYRNQLGKKLREEHAARDIPAVHVSVHLAHEQVLLSRSTRNALATQLLAFVAANLPAENCSAEFEWSTLSSELSEMGVHAIHVLRRKALTKPFWGFPHSAFVPESTADRVQTVINDKAPNVAAYRRRAEKLWLVIVSGTQGLQSIVDADAGALNATYTSQFDRLFLLRTFGGTVHELKRHPLADC